MNHQLVSEQTSRAIRDLIASHSAMLLNWIRFLIKVGLLDAAHGVGPPPGPEPDNPTAPEGSGSEHSIASRVWHLQCTKQRSLLRATCYVEARARARVVLAS